MQDVDVNFRSYADMSEFRLEDEFICPPHSERYDYDDILKFSHVSKARVSRISVVGGNENAIDLNRECDDVVFNKVFINGGLQCAIVVKGGSTNIKFNDVEIASEQGHYDIELGGWSDQSKKRTRNVTLSNISRLDGKPVLVVVGNAELPSIKGGNVKVLFWRSLALKLFIFYRLITG
jgi:hypothetical protein